MRKEFTDAELRQVAEFVARRYLEVERGLRPREALRRFLSPKAFVQLADDGVSLFPGGGVVRQADVRRMIFQRPTPRRAHVSIPARQQGDGWGALVMELRADRRGVWRVTELTRVQDRNLTTRRLGDDTAFESGPTDLPPGSTYGDSGRQQRYVSNDDMVRAARWAAQDRYERAARQLAAVAPEKPAAELRPGDVVGVGTGSGGHWVEVRSAVADDAAGEVVVGGSDGSELRLLLEQPVPVLAATEDDVHAAQRAAREASGDLQAAAGEIARLERQLAELDGRSRPAPAADAYADRSETPSLSYRDVDTPSYLRRFLGRRPVDVERRRLWDEAAEVIESYRQKWGVTTTRSVLGARPDDPHQLADRQAVVDALRELADQLPRVGSSRTSERDQYPPAQADAPFGHSGPGR